MRHSRYTKDGKWCMICDIAAEHFPKDPYYKDHPLVKSQAKEKGALGSPISNS